MADEFNEEGQVLDGAGGFRVNHLDAIIGGNWCYIDSKGEGFSEEDQVLDGD